MKAEEFRKMTAEEIRQELEKMQREMFNLRFQLKTNALMQTDNVRKARRDIARASTVLNEKLKEQEKNAS